jgi:hypothetical protein
MGGEDAYTGRSVRRRKQRAIAGAVLVGLAAAASATVFAGGMQAAGSSATSSIPLADFTSNAMHAGQDIETAVHRVGGATSEADLAAACQQMRDANQRLNATLPSPVPALTSELQGVVDEIGAASRVCLAANAGRPNIGLFKLHVNAALAHYTRAQQIVLGG